MLTPTFRDHSSFRLAGLRRFHTFADAPHDIPAQWAEFNQLPIPGLNDTKIFYGATCQTDLPNQRFEYMCAFEVPDFTHLDSTVGRMIVPEQHYAVFTHSGGLPTLHDTWQYIWKQMAPFVRPETRPNTRLRTLRRALQPHHRRRPNRNLVPHPTRHGPAMTSSSRFSPARITACLFGLVIVLARPDDSSVAPCSYPYIPWAVVENIPIAFGNRTLSVSTGRL
jgi:AraC family transcriptional regulator